MVPIWKKTLFWEILLLTILGFYFFVFGNWFLALTSPDEGKNAYAALHMLTSGDWVIPYYNCHYRFEKPPLLYWLVALSFKVFGVNEFAARLPSGLAALGTTLTTYFLVRDFLSPKKAFMGASVFILLIHTWVESRAVVPEMVLTFFSTLGVYLFLKEKPLWGWLSLALAFLAKGPVGVLLPLAVVFIFKLLREGNFFQTLRWFLKNTFHPLGIVLFLIVGGSWYILVFYKVGWEFFYKFFILENIDRFTGRLGHHLYPWWYYLPVLAAATLLFWPLILLRFKKLFSKGVAPFGGWFLFVFLFYSASKGKLHHYLLFSYPALSGVFANALTGRYLKIAYPLGFVLLSTLLGFAYYYNLERFTPKAVQYLKRENPKHLYFYGVENSAIVFYLNRCIPHLKDPNGAPKGSYLITSKGDLKNIKVPYEVVVKGKEPKREEYLIRLGGND